MLENSNENYLDTLDPDNNYFADNFLNFSAYTIDTFADSGITENGSLNIMHHNSRSILAEDRIDDYDFLLGPVNYPFHVMGFMSIILFMSWVSLKPG